MYGRAVDENIDLVKILEKKSNLHSQRVSDMCGDYQTIRDGAASPYSSINKMDLPVAVHPSVM